jgi:hypothetical protein
MERTSCMVSRLVLPGGNNHAMFTLLGSPTANVIDSYFKPPETVSVKAWRSGIIGGCGHDYGAYALSGAQTISVEPVQATATLSASQSVVAPGTSVTFTASISPTTATPGGITIPWQVTAWNWVPSDDGGPVVTSREGPGRAGPNLRVSRSLAQSTTVCAGNGSTCTISVNGSGTMYVDVTVNGIVQPPEEAPVFVVAPDTCPPQNPSDTSEHDPRLADTVFVNSMLRHLAAAKKDKNLERGGDAGINQAGQHTLRRIPAISVSTCHYTPDLGNVPLLPNGYDSVGVFWHVHAHRPNMLSYGCVAPGVKPTEPYRPPPGPSPDDWSYTYPRGLTGYMIDGNGDIWRWNYPPQPPGGDNYDPSSTHFKRQKNAACYVRIS